MTTPIRRSECLVMVGVGHQAAPLELRERLTLSLADWKARSALRRPVILLSTCNRLELYAWSDSHPANVARSLVRGLGRATGIDRLDLESHVTTRLGTSAIHHLVRVACGLDSLVVGEEQIRGQVREAYRLASESGELPGALEGIFHRTLEAARTLATDTPFGRRPSIASAAVSVCARLPLFHVGGLQGQSVVILGAGSMARAAAEAMAARGAVLTLLSRGLEGAEQLAMRLGSKAHAGSLDELPDALQFASVLIGATASRLPIVQAAQIAEVLNVRAGRPLVILDIALPRDVDPAARHVPGVQLFDLDDLEKLCPVDVSERSAEVLHAEGRATAQAQKIERWLRVRALSPVISSLRSRGERIRDEELRRSAQRLRDLTPEQRSAVEALASGIVNKLLHGPTLAIRESANGHRSGGPTRAAVASVLRFDERREPGRS